MCIRDRYKNLDPKFVGKIKPSIPFPAGSDVSLSCSQLRQSLTTVVTDILSHCDDTFADIKSSTWVDGWLRPLQRALEEAIDFTSPEASKLSNMLDNHFEQAARALT